MSHRFLRLKIRDLPHPRPQTATCLGCWSLRSFWCCGASVSHLSLHIKIAKKTGSSVSLCLTLSSRITSLRAFGRVVSCSEIDAVYGVSLRRRFMNSSFSKCVPSLLL